MLTVDQVPASDFTPARLLAQKTRTELAVGAGRSVVAVERLEYGQRVQWRTRVSVFAALVDWGVRFHGPGDLRHVDGRTCLARRRMGTLHGERLRIARTRLGLRVT